MAGASILMPHLLSTYQHSTILSGSIRSCQREMERTKLYKIEMSSTYLCERALMHPQVACISQKNPPLAKTVNFESQVDDPHQGEVATAMSQGRRQQRHSKPCSYVLMCVRVRAWAYACAPYLLLCLNQQRDCEKRKAGEANQHSKHGWQADDETD